MSFARTGLRNNPFMAFRVGGVLCFIIHGSFWLRREFEYFRSEPPGWVTGLQGLPTALACLKERLLVVTWWLCSWRCRNCHWKASQLWQTGRCVLVRRHTRWHPHGLCVSSWTSSWLKMRALVHVGRVGNRVLCSAAKEILQRKSHLPWVMATDHQDKHVFSIFSSLCSHQILLT